MYMNSTGLGGTSAQSPKNVKHPQYQVQLVLYNPAQHITAGCPGKVTEQPIYKWYRVQHL